MATDKIEVKLLEIALAAQTKEQAAVEMYKYIINHNKRCKAKFLPNDTDEQIHIFAECFTNNVWNQRDSDTHKNKLELNNYEDIVEYIRALKPCTIVRLGICWQYYDGKAYPGVYVKTYPSSMQITQSNVKELLLSIGLEKLCDFQHVEILSGYISNEEIIEEAIRKIDPDYKEYGKHIIESYSNHWQQIDGKHVYVLDKDIDRYDYTIDKKGNIHIAE